MRRKKLAIYISLVAVFTLILAMIPLQYLNASVITVYLSEGGKHVVGCGSDLHSIKYNVKDGVQKNYKLDIAYYKPPGWNSRFKKVEFMNGSGEFFSVNLKPGCSPTTVDGYNVSWHVNNYVEVCDRCPCSACDIVWIKFYYTGKTKDCEDVDASSARPMEMTCSNVWINEANNFEFVFLYEYANNNWVKIYDMAGVEVFSIDMPHGKASFVADLPDGMYTVKTFHDGMATPIQEFIIGKP